MANKHGLYMVGHGTTKSDVFCFLPPLFTEIAMAENYGRVLTNMRCKYSKQPVFSMINDINLNLIGQVITKKSKATFIEFPDMQHTGIAIIDAKNNPDVSWSVKLEKDNIFKYFIGKDTTAYILSYMNLSFNTKNGEISGSIFYPPELYNLPLANFTHAELNKLIETDVSEEGSISTIDVRQAEQYMDAIPSASQNTSADNPHVNCIKRLCYIGYINSQFLKLLGIEAVDPVNDIYNYLSTDYLAMHANKLLLDNVLHVDVAEQTTPKLRKFLHKNKYEAGISVILNQLKANLIESRLMKSSTKKSFKLWSASCRPIATVEERRSKYNTIKSIFEPQENTPKSLQQFALDNTRELRPDGEEMFKGILSPHIVITNILYPCFLYCMDPDTCDLLPEFTDEIRGLFQYMIVNLPLYTLNKPSVLRFIELVTPKLVDAILTSIIGSSSEQVRYARLFASAFTTLTGPAYKYTAEDIILVYGVVIYNLPTYLDLSSASYRTASNIHPREYKTPHTNVVANNTETTDKSTPHNVYGTIWNLPNNSSSGQPTDNARVAHITSKKQRKHLAKQSLRTKRVFSKTQDARQPLSGYNLIKIATATMLSGKYPYLTHTVRTNPEKYIPRMFQMVTRINV